MSRSSRAPDKGFIAKRPKGRSFETGTHILKGLELASPYTWQLAKRDRFGRGGTMYQPGNVLCTVLVGNTGYHGISSIANEEGSDGTVRVSTANMSCVRINAVFPARPDDEGVGYDVEYELEESSGATAFGVLDGHNHGTITLSHRKRDPVGRVERTKRDGDLLEKIVRGLTVTDEEFETWCQELADRNRALLPSTATRGGRKHGLQNTVVHVQDQYGVSVDDYLLEFYEEDDDRAQESRTAAQDVPVRPLACGPARRPALSRTRPWTMLAQRETLLIQWQWWQRRDSNPNHVIR